MHSTHLKLERTNRVLKMLSDINRSIVRADSPDQLYADACRIAVECGLFQFAWIGLLDAHTGNLRLIARYGGPAVFPENLLSPHGLAASVCHREKLCVYGDLLSLPSHFQGCDVMRRELRAMAGLPLDEEGRITGVFSLYSNQRACFDQTVIDLLREVADDISFSLGHMLGEQRHLAAEARLRYLAFYDAQTGLPNRALLEEKLPAMAADAKQKNGLLGIFDIRLRRLDQVAHIVGSAAMDDVLRTLAARLEHCYGNDGMLAQLGQDEFVMVSSEMDVCGDIETIAQCIYAAMAVPIRTGDREVFVHASIGCVVYPLHEEDIRKLLRRARTAAEKSNAEERLRIYSADLDRGLEQRVQMEAELHRALERDEFELYYQPQQNLKTGRIVGVEALLRWRHPERGMILPTYFIPLLEECGLITAVGDWVLWTACRQAQLWRQQGLPPLRMAVNLSAQQFRLANLAKTVQKILEETELDAVHLELELTESMILENAECTIRTMHELKTLGVSLSLDDFGTGYSSLSYLCHYPVERIKIDQSFIREMTQHLNCAALVRSILSMADNLGLQTIAEGVETQQQFGYLQEQLCQEMQGYLFSRPLSAENMGQFLQQEHAQKI